MTDTIFTALVQQKIVERREGRSAAAQAATEADARFRARTAPLVARALEMMKDLSSDPMFANAMGYPDVSIRREDADGRIGVVSFAGLAGVLSFQTFNHGGIGIRIYPEPIVMGALECGLSYGIDPLKGELSRIDDLMARVRDHIAEFLADIYLSLAAHILQSKPQGLTG